MPRYITTVDKDGAVTIEPRPTATERRLHERLIAAVPSMPPRTRRRVLDAMARSLADEVNRETQLQRPRRRKTAQR
jgi:hypothetical protein